MRIGSAMEWGQVAPRFLKACAWAFARIRRVAGARQSFGTYAAHRTYHRTFRRFAGTIKVLMDIPGQAGEERS